MSNKPINLSNPVLHDGKLYSQLAFDFSKVKAIGSVGVTDGLMVYETFLADAATVPVEVIKKLSIVDRNTVTDSFIFYQKTNGAAGNFVNYLINTRRLVLH